LLIFKFLNHFDIIFKFGFKGVALYHCETTATAVNIVAVVEKLLSLPPLLLDEAKKNRQIQKPKTKFSKSFTNSGNTFLPVSRNAKRIKKGIAFHGKFGCFC